MFIQSGDINSLQYLHQNSKNSFTKRIVFAILYFLYCRRQAGEGERETRYKVG